MPPGRYPHHVTIEAPAVDDGWDGEGAIGEQTVTFSKAADAYAYIEPLRGREYWAAAQIQAETTHEIRMRPLDITLTNRHEIVFGTRRFEIEAVRNIGERNVELVLMCKEKV